MSNWNNSGSFGVSGCGGQPQYVNSNNTLGGLQAGSGMFMARGIPPSGAAIVASSEQDGPNTLIDMRSDGGQVARIDKNGDYMTPVRSLSNYTRARISDTVEINGQNVFLWDIMHGLPGVKQHGRWLEFTQDHSNALGLYIQRGGFAGMDVQEFIRKTVRRVKNKRTRGT